MAAYLINGPYAPTKFNAQAGDVMTFRVDGLTLAAQELARLAMDVWAEASGLVFVEVTSGFAQIMFDDLDPSGAYSTQQSFNGFTTWAYINIPQSWTNAYGTTIDSYSFQTFIHEAGHALGLGHGGNYNGSINFGSDAVFENDSWQLTVMSYVDQIANPYVIASYAYTITAMIADIEAMEILYGGSVETNTGNSVYGANSNIDGYLGTVFGILYDGDAPDPAFWSGDPVTFTINDDGGIDLLDFSTFHGNQVLNLNEEGISNVGGLIGNMVIGRGSQIENGATGDGDDEIIGNALDNTLNAGGGADVVFAGNGNDTVFGGAQFDILLGGNGADAVIGGNGGDILFGGTGTDRLDGGVGNDWLVGGLGGDTFVFNDLINGARDMILDFRDGLDVIELADTTFGALSFTNMFGGVEINVDGHEIFVAGVFAADLTSDDFNFV
ncbi:M10 family metallopeptidase C-terminal domain-containing protein [Actibacterium mucosum]|nr:M10 family metallopeptidase C-terminal domain-containing protein [Actibacterium mucosum]